MATTDLEVLKQATARLVGGGASGTGYLIARQRIATCEHVVRNWPDGKGTVSLGPSSRQFAATVLKVDPVADCAVVQISGNMPVQPLPLAGVPSRKAVWDGFGFPAIARAAGLPIDGHVADPEAKDDRGVAALLLYSPEVAAGQASPLHGFSGSPVLVQGAVVGHLRKHLGDPDDARRGAYGFVYASPVAAVRALLEDVPFESRELTTVPVDSLGEHIPELANDQFHVFISYRSIDNAFAKNLTRRLEGAGLRVYLAESQLRPGEVIRGVSAALTNSKAAIAIVSRPWLESPWCAAEMQHLTQRAMTDDSFRLIPVRIDRTAALPPLLGDRKCFDIDPAAFENEMLGAEIMGELLWELIGKPRPSADSAAHRVATEESVAVQKFSLELKLAADRGATRVVSVWKDWKLSRLVDISPALSAVEILIGQARPDLALQVLDDLRKGGLRAQQLRGLALSKSAGRRDDAIAVFERLRSAGHRDPETTGNLAAAYKARVKQTGSAADLQRAYELYLESYELNADPYTGINAAALALRIGDEEKSRDLADAVAADLEKKPKQHRDHWDWASLGQAYLLARRKAKASECYRVANTRAGRRARDVAVMREGARDDLDALGERRNALDNVFTVPNVVAFVGHLTDREGRNHPRFPMGKVTAVRLEIRRRLQRLRPVHGFSGIARGSDIIFVEELLAVEGAPYVILPIPPADFRRVSVGEPWNERFDELIGNDRVAIELLNLTCVPEEELPNVFDRANRKAQRLAIEHAEKLFGKPTVIAVWDGKPGDGKGGTADAVQGWQLDGYEVDIIDVTKL